jgi:hypothetical protein
VGAVGEDGVERAGQPPVLLADTPQLVLEALRLSKSKRDFAKRIETNVGDQQVAVR